jgi:hypothetical protein
MDRRLAQTIAGLTIVLLLVACGGNSGNDSANKTATARTADANDAATVTAFASGGRTSGAGTTTGATPGTALGAGTRVAGKSGGFTFATLAPGGATGGGQSAATGATPSTGRTAGSASAGNGGTPAGVSGNTYTDPQGRFKLTIPQGWQVQATSGASVDFEATPNTLKGAFQIAAEDVGASTSIDDYASGTMDSIKQSVTNYQDAQNGIQQTTVGGLPARRFDFTAQDGTTNLRAAVIVVEKGTTAYGFLIAADPADFDAVFAQAKQFIDTFSFLS